jgi:hypothetical protein
MLKLQSFDEHFLYWTGTYGENIISNGEFCVNLECKQIETDDRDRTGFSMKSIENAIEVLTLIYRKNLAESLTINTSLKKIRSPYCNENVQNMMLIQDLKVFDCSSEKVECKTCMKYVLRKRIRNHIGRHLVLKEIDPNPKNCGLCGMIGCSIDIVITGRGKAAVGVPNSDCKYFDKFSINCAKKSTGLSPCTNRPINCEACNNCFWSYNIEAHYKVDHLSLEVPSSLIPSKEEIKKLKNLVI